MKLHLPKLLLTAVLAACGLSQTVWAANEIVTYTGTFTIPGYTTGLEATLNVKKGTEGTPIKAEDVGEASYIVLGKEATNDYRYTITEDVFADGSTIILASGSFVDADGKKHSITGSQLFFDMHAKNQNKQQSERSGVTINNDIILGSHGTNSADAMGVIRMHDSANDARIVLSGNITLVQNATISNNKAFSYIEGAITGDYTITTKNGGTLNLSGGANIGGIAGDNAIVLDAHNATQVATEHKDYTFGSYTSSKDLTLWEGINLTITGSVDTAGGIINKAGTVVFGTDTDADTDVVVNSQVGRLELSDHSSLNKKTSVTINSGYTLKVTGTSSDWSTGALVLGEWGTASRGNIIVHGALLAEGADALMAEGGGLIHVKDGGIVGIKGIKVRNNSTTMGLTVDNGGTLVLGEDGISSSGATDSGKYSSSIGGTIGIMADEVTIARGLNIAGTAILDTTQYAISGYTIAQSTENPIGGTLKISGNLSGSGALQVQGAGTLELSGSNNYSGGTTLLSGKIKISNGAALGSGIINLDGGTLEVANTMTLSNKIDLAGGCDPNNGDTPKMGELSIQNNATLTLGSGSQIWVGNNSSIAIASGASLVKGGTTITGTGDGATITRKDIGAAVDVNENINEFRLESDKHIISNAAVKISSESEVTVANKLENVAVTNNNTGLLKITNEDNTLTELHALKGSISVTEQSEIVLNALTIAKGNTLTVDTVAVCSPVATFSTESPTSTATLEGGAKVAGNLDLSNANVLTLNGIGEGSLVTVTGNFELPEGTLTLGGNILDTLAGLADGTSVDVFSVGAFTLGGQAITSNLTADSGYTLDTVFKGGSADYYLGYTVGNNGGGIVYIGKVIPEPTTATLSLLALAGLAARRRRK